tara:strand:+ start:1249 stop:1584 length:336 start_codon:yes stop_codon:yes gene_type:complete
MANPIVSDSTVYDVWHCVTKKVRFEELKEDRSIKDYKSIGKCTAINNEDVFCKMQHIDEEGFRDFDGSQENRSLSVGDIIVNTSDKTYWVCQEFGWKELIINDETLSLKGG